jgi:fructose-1,6-bisphosphatase I
MRAGVTLSRFIMEEQRQYPHATGDFSGLLNAIALAGKLIAREVNKAGLANILGLTGKINIQGEEVQKLDQFANEVMINSLNHIGHLCIMASEEVADPIRIPEKFPRGRYTCFFDPLDGSSNIDANVSIGTIFSIHRRLSESGDGVESDLLQKGSSQVCAGYIIYGSSTMFVYSVGQGVHGFTLDPGVGEFLLSHENIKTPPRGKIYSTNEGNYNFWHQGAKRYVDYLKSNENKLGKPYTSRYIGSLVADFHRNLLYGGIFLYPADMKDPKKPKGKLRLLCEADPLGFIAEQAGGLASAGSDRILEIEPQELHQRVPLIIGSREDVLEAESFIKGN